MLHGVAVTNKGCSIPCAFLLRHRKELGSAKDPLESRESSGRLQRLSHGPSGDTLEINENTELKRA